MMREKPHGRRRQWGDSFAALLMLFIMTSPTGADDTPIVRFPVFDALHSRRDTPTDRPVDHYGMRPIAIFYRSALWPAGSDPDQPNLPQVRRLVSRLKGSTLVCLDVEHWPLTGDREVVERSVDKLIAMADAAHEAAPTVTLGFYGVLPLRSYWGAVAPTESKQYQDWVAQCDAVRRLVDHVDVLFPSLYTFYDKPDAWETYARNTITVARRYNKPVVVFLWPQYHESSDLKNTYLDAAFWSRQLKVCHEAADGIVLWDRPGPGAWDENAPWWLVTRQFLEDLRK
ncbi:MAG: hypothetical protein GC162_01830 [Planctomycetes bacterium]|nr:hypothetical protein [Planctomycetota bacterium]